MYYEYLVKYTSDKGAWYGACAFEWAQEWYFKTYPEYEERAKKDKKFKYFIAWLNSSGYVLLYRSNFIKLPPTRQMWGGCGDYYVGQTYIGYKKTDFYKWLKSKGVKQVRRYAKKDTEQISCSQSKSKRDDI